MAADVELTVYFQRVVHLNLVGKRIAAVFAAIGVGERDAGAVGAAVAALQLERCVKQQAVDGAVAQQKFAYGFQAALMAVLRVIQAANKGAEFRAAKELGDGLLGVLRR